ncbi:MAG: hypothetical protein CME06_09525 [Gemmatimonadetes bacterium]|nr:hypothetical protein [Gemmatimonadota bacterium]
MKSRILLAQLVVSPCVSAFGADHHVPRDFGTIQEAIDAANLGDWVIVHPGHYPETIDLNGKAIVVTSTDPLDHAIVSSTVIDANGTGSVVTFASEEGPNTILQGFRLTGGTGTAYDGDEGPGFGGGGIYCSGPVSPMIRSCIVSNNHVDGGWARGGGIYCHEGASPTVHGCLIRSNSVSGNPAAGGATTSWEGSPTFENVVMEDNWLIDTNLADLTYGGAMSSTYSEVTVRNSILRNNTAHVYRAGGVDCSFSSYLFENCILEGNSGHGIVLDNESTALLRNCVITNSMSTGLTSVTGSFATLLNTIVWNNGDVAIDVEYSSHVEATYSNIAGGWPGSGNFEADPVFTSLRRFDYLLDPDSPCVDSGDPSIDDALSDWHPRWPAYYPNGRRSDVGAYGGPGNWDWLD